MLHKPNLTYPTGNLSSVGYQNLVKKLHDTKFENKNKIRNYNIERIRQMQAHSLFQIQD